MDHPRGPPYGRRRLTRAHPRGAVAAPQRGIPTPEKNWLARLKKSDATVKKTFGVLYKIINHTRKIEYVIFKEGAHFKKNQNALATKSNCDVYKIVCHLCKSQKPHAKNPGPPFRRPDPPGAGPGMRGPAVHRPVPEGGPFLVQMKI